MVRCSERMTMINKIENQLLMRADLNHLRYLFDLTDDFEDGVDEDLCNLYTELVNTRYLAQRGPYRKPDHCVFTSWLVDERKHTARDFLDQFRLSREALWDLVNLIKDDPALQSVPGEMMQPPPEHHLMVLLFKFGIKGNGACAQKIAKFFMIGLGSVINNLRRAIVAVLNLKTMAVTWPDAQERREIASDIKREYGVPNCVSIMDGTLLPFEFKPSLYGEDYHTRKSNYALNAMILCDHNARVR